VLRTADFAAGHRPTLERLGSLFAARSRVEANCVIALLSLTVENVHAGERSPAVMPHVVTFGTTAAHLESGPDAVLDQGNSL
jgi:hypothetical protein